MSGVVFHQALFNVFNQKEPPISGSRCFGPKTFRTNQLANMNDFDVSANTEI